MGDFYFILHSIAELIIIGSGFIIIVAFIIWALYLHAENEERNKKRQENSSLPYVKSKGENKMPYSFYVVSAYDKNGELLRKVRLSSSFDEVHYYIDELKEEYPQSNDVQNIMLRRTF